MSTPPNAEKDAAVLGWYLQQWTAQGWRVISQAATGAQLERPKRLNPFAVGLFVITPLVLSCPIAFLAGIWAALPIGLALLVLLILVADYLVRRPEQRYVTLADAYAAARAFWASHPELTPPER